MKHRSTTLALLLLIIAAMLAACAPAAMPTEAPTEALTQAPTEAPLEVVTEEPTEVPTEAPTEPALEGEIVVFAASSLTNAFDEIKAAFEEANPGTTVTISYASSSDLATQLTEGAPADVFASANNTQMQAAVDGGRIEAEPTTFVTNRLVIITPSDNPAGIESLIDLATPGVKLVLAAPGVPIRDYSEQVFAKAAEDAAFGPDFPAQVLANLVSEEENVRQVATKIGLGEGDGAIVYKSDVTPDLAPQVQQIDIPDEFNVLASYPIAPVADSEHTDVAEAFIAFILSPDGQAILEKWGFGPANAE
jgi:molybdate transport system substrate-binding protein